MKREDLFSLADKVGLGFIRHASDKDIEKFEGLVKLVAFNEREAIAVMVEPWLMPEYVKKIRNRGQA